MSLRSRCAAALLIVTIPMTALACLWDYDTLKQERARFPDTLELITGKFLRHSKEFYEWRIQDRLKKLEAEPNNLGYLDDLAVAYDKSGQNAKAIETMERKEKIKPGQYETYANLSVFYVHAGNLEKSLEYVDKALAINPDAHFGRERYQKYLIEYLLSRQKDGKIPLPVQEVGAGRHTDSVGFGAFLQTRVPENRRDKIEGLSRDERAAAIKGVLGMIRFANHESPILLEALGDLLTHYGEMAGKTDAKNLGVRAYLRASYTVGDKEAQAAYRKLADQGRQMQTKGPDSHEQISLAAIEAEFRTELDDAERWYANLRERELAWIRDGSNPEAEFDKLYTEEPRIAVEGGVEPGHNDGETILDPRLTTAAIAIGAIAAIGFIVFLSRRAGRSAG